MSTNPRISVVLPAFDAVHTIGRAIGSIRAQTFTEWEMLVVDDGSSDGTAAVAAELALQDPRIRLITCGHAGIVAALNAGLAAARGRLIARMDADDESHPERLAAQLALLDAENGLGLASCLVEFGGDRAANAGYALHVDWINSLLAPEQIAVNRFVESPLAHPSVVFRRELMDRLGRYRAGDFPEDYELWLRWLDAGVRMAKVPRALLRWHDRPGRLSRHDPRYDADRFFAVKAPWIAAELARVRDDRPLWVWGAGRPTRKRAAHLAGHGITIAAYVDIDPRKTGRAVAGIPVVSPARLPPRGDVFILGYVGSRGARELTRGELLVRGYREGTDFLMCA